MKDLTPQQELEYEENLKQEFETRFDKCNLEELYWVKEVLDKEIRLSETATAEGFE